MKNYYAYYNGEIQLNEQEIDDGRFWDISEIQENIDNGVFTVNFEKDFEVLFSNGRHLPRYYDMTGIR